MLYGILPLIDPPVKSACGKGRASPSFKLANTVSTIAQWLKAREPRFWHTLKRSYVEAAIIPNNSATSVMAISRVRRLKRRLSHGATERVAAIRIKNQFGNCKK